MKITFTTVKIFSILSNIIIKLKKHFILDHSMLQRDVN